jgi:two-component system alkaline phosphatase synthesis response regulator PhoP
MENGSKKRIVIIEDNAAFLNMLKIRLELNGYEVFTSMDGVEGLELVRDSAPDLIILDLALPDMSNDNNSELSAVDKSLGHKICRMIKFDHKLKSIPVLILTASDTVEDEEVARRVGADAFLVKTLPTDQMLYKIRELLQKGKYISKSPI